MIASRTMLRVFLVSPTLQLLLVLQLLVLLLVLLPGDVAAQLDMLEDPSLVAVTTAARRNPQPPVRKPRIVNGDRSVPSNRPFFARAGYDEYYFTNDVLCGSTLIWSDIAITAAHCQGAFNSGLLILDAFTKDYTKKAPINRQIRHPGWSTNRQNLNYDVLVMRLTTPLSSSDAAKFIPINTDSNLPRNNQQLKAYGFGVTNAETGAVSDHLREADVTYIDNNECFGRGIKFNNVLNSREVMCTDPDSAGEKTATCLGDSGGPLTDSTGSTLLGVISFGSGCEADLIPDGHARMSEVSDWVEEQICLLSANPPPTCRTTTTSSSSNNSNNNSNDPGAVEVVVDFSHDFYPEHTVFAVRSKNLQETFYAGPEYIPTRSGEHRESFWLSPGEYIFQVYDTAGDGLVSDRGNGSWKLSALYDRCSSSETQTQIASSGTASFTSEQQTKFVVGNAKVTGNCGGSYNSLNNMNNNNNNNNNMNNNNNNNNVLVTVGNIGEDESDKDALAVEQLVEQQLEDCLVRKKTESSVGASFSTTCRCAPSDSDSNSNNIIELSCSRGDGSACVPNHGTCSASDDCCSGRRCIGGKCRTSSSDAAGGRGRDSNRLGGSGIGGAAGRTGRTTGNTTSGKNLRGR